MFMHILCKKEEETTTLNCYIRDKMKSGPGWMGTALRKITTNGGQESGRPTNTIDGTFGISLHKFPLS